MGEWRMNAPTLFDFPETVKKPRWGDLATSLSFDEKEIIRWIMLLHNNGQPFELDPTYSIGRFWEDLPKPKYKFDINPQVEGVTRARAEQLPLANESVNSIMFDPPFLMKGADDRKLTGILEKRFSGYKTYKELFKFYELALLEFWRVLRPAGVLAFKCQDSVSWKRQHLSHYEILKHAEKIGYYAKDLFVLARTNILWSPNMANQQHARKSHCYFIVFVKPKSRKS